ncbi:MAG TPA: ABC transporter ATP-binding protein [Polyangia bacterium]|jgi:peptide/nickel transport system ATP-binding protein|nr:ABC transporter ATP-binding protein [Polyangia bacterium]
MADAPSDLLSVENLEITFLTAAGDVSVVDDVSFRVGAGEAFGLAGESGGGKSTIAQAILRVLRPPAAITGGRILFGGVDVLSMDDAALSEFRWKQVSLVTQGAMNALNPVLRVREQIVDTIQAHKRVSRAEAADRAVELFRIVGIDVERLDRFPHQLSGGMRQRVVIAIALALRPKLLIMDEPTTALDVVVQRELLTQILELKEKLGFSILFITHDLALMLQVCSRVGIVYGGRLIETAPSASLLRTPQHPYTRSLVGCFLDVHQPRASRAGIPGAPFDPRQPPPGCRFHPRCSFVFERCRREIPLLIGRGPDHASACHLGQPGSP